MNSCTAVGIFQYVICTLHEFRVHRLGRSGVLEGVQERGCVRERLQRWWFYLSVGVPLSIVAEALGPDEE